MRILAVIALAVVCLPAAACGGSEPASTAAQPTTEPPAPEAPATEAPATTEAPETETSGTTEEPAQTETPGPAADAFTIEVKDGAPVGGVQELTVAKGDAVHLEVEVDAPQEIHVHGYELEQDATPAKPAVFDFSANLEGIFDVETHASDAQIGKLVVEP